jgi:uncharacterized membrane protein YhaH (DUF805 family)
LLDFKLRSFIFTGQTSGNQQKSKVVIIEHLSTKKEIAGASSPSSIFLANLNEIAAHVKEKRYRLFLSSGSQVVEEKATPLLFAYTFFAVIAATKKQLLTTKASNEHLLLLVCSLLQLLSQNSLRAIFFLLLFFSSLLFLPACGCIGPASGSNNNPSEPQQESSSLKQVVLREHCRQKTASRLACPP